MTTMKTNDGSQYVLVLTKEQAELLGTFRFSHVGGSSPLYAVLRGLPHKMGARFRTGVAPCDDKPIFHDLIQADMTSSNARLIRDLLDDSLFVQDEAPCKIPRSPEPEKPEPKKWIVQFNAYNGWRSCGGFGCCANGEYTSRNEAYRQMRTRIKKYGTPADSYRVVPKGTAAGPERDRGHYTVEFFAKLSYPKGWRSTTSVFMSGTFPTAARARRAINTHVAIADRHRYRVKWHPNRS